MKNGIVIQGGGSKGAFTCGRIEKANKSYDLAVGSSTGALIAPFALLQDYATLKNTYTTTGNKDVYKRYPFWKGGIPNMLMCAVAYYRGKKGVADSEPLRDLIRKSFTESHYKSIIEQGKDCFFTLCMLNSNENTSKYVQLSKNSYETVCETMWASTLVPGLFPPLTTQSGIDFVDGGTTENVGLKKAVEMGCTDIDVYLHSLKSSGIKDSGKNWAQNLFRAITIQRQEVINDDLDGPFDKPITIERKYLPFELEGAHIMEFNPEVMSYWYAQGYNLK